MIRSFFIVGALFLSVMAATAQVQPSQQQPSLNAGQDMTVVKPKLPLGDVKVVARFIETVEIKGTEVEAFLDVKKALNAASEAGSKAGKKDEDLIVVEMRMDVANTFYVLMQRATLKGQDAEKFKMIISALQDAAREAAGQKK